MSMGVIQFVFMPHLPLFYRSLVSLSVPIGQMGSQPERHHWDTVCICVCVCLCCTYTFLSCVSPPGSWWKFLQLTDLTDRWERFQHHGQLLVSIRFFFVYRQHGLLCPMKASIIEAWNTLWSITYMCQQPKKMWRKVKPTLWHYRFELRLLFKSKQTLNPSENRLRHFNAFFKCTSIRRVDLWLLIILYLRPALLLIVFQWHLHSLFDQV